MFDEEIGTDTKNNTLKQNTLNTSIIVDKASNISINNADDYMEKNFFHDINNKHKIEREEKNKETEDLHNNKQKSPSASNEEKGKIVANTFNHKSIENKMDILNTKRNNTYVNVNVIDKNIQAINNLHHNVDNNLGPGVQLYPSTNTTKDRKTAVKNERPYSENVYRSSTKIKEKMITHSALLLTANSKDVSDSQGTCRYYTHDDVIIGNAGKSRTKEKIRNDNKISITTSKESNRINTEIVNSTSD